MQSGNTDRKAPSEPAANPKTLSVPEAGRIYFELGRNASYAAAARGDIPTLKSGRDSVCQCWRSKGCWKLPDRLAARLESVGRYPPRG